MKQIISGLFFFVVNVSLASVVLPSVFSDHMVLQQRHEIKIWGWASPGEMVAVSPSWTEQVYTTKGDNQAQWELILRTPQYGGPYHIKIKGNNEILLKDILIGEVWLCSGQSNMEMSASWGIDNGDTDVAQAHHPQIRFFNVPKKSARTPQDDLPAQWETCSPESMKNSSAIAYFFARKLREELGEVPVGLIVSAWGGTPAEVWIPEETIEKNTELASAANQLTPVVWGPVEPARAYNAMIHPLVGYGLAGTLWYQGEANTGSQVYEKTLGGLIGAWREKWESDFPFYFVQIAPYQYGGDNVNGVEIRDAQRRVLENVQNTAMVVISDVSPVDDIHPKDKKSVGERLAKVALKKHYGSIHGLVESPLFKQVTFNKNKAIITFEHADGLYAKDKKSLFEIAGHDKKFFPATFVVEDKTIVVSSKKVKDPKYVRFAWGNTLQANIFNMADLPASSFTTLE
ncbi:sialate O-acetylesterase [Muricauda sp. CAU 1633]|uniref:sialate O-acetylesterase n=1 Tax=Allomuricauda sp. CAU 1633 TaxID=2816036 RepID=UPI001A8EC2B0|nr:sialate O-acetylesterase [Muricauda sp. CAU 1633]MBO0322187.1 sialate O-acetylesterase [Muricauda sp. CAU 1633]